MNASRYSADGSPLKALKNIEGTLNFLMDEETAERINWHPSQNIHLAVMRLLSEYNELKDRMKGLEQA